MFKKPLGGSSHPLRTGRVKIEIIQAHVSRLGNYLDDQIHNHP